MAEEREAPAWWGLLAGQAGAQAAVLAGGVALHATNVFLASTILPSVVRDIGGREWYAWNTTLFVVASILGSALSAALLRRAGPRRAYALAGVVFGLGSLLCAAAPDVAAMLAGRTVQGLGGGLLFALAYGLIRLVFPEALWPRAMALVSSMWGAATLLGPAIGGMFAEWDAWRWAFWVLVPITALFALGAWRVLPPGAGAAGPGRPVPMPQLLLLVAAVMAVSAGSVAAGVAWPALGLLVSLGLTAWLLRLEARAPRRLFPHSAFRWGGQPLALYATLCLLSVGVTSAEIFVPLLLQELHGLGPLAAGYLSALMAAGWTLGSVRSSGRVGAAADATLRRAPWVVLAGMLALLVLVPWPEDGAGWLLAPMLLALTAVGYGVGTAWPHLLTRVLQAAPEEERDLASASLTTVQLFSTSMGAALSGMVANLAGLTEPGGTGSAAFWLFVLFALAPALGAFTARRL